MWLIPPLWSLPWKQTVDYNAPIEEAHRSLMTKAHHGRIGALQPEALPIHRDRGPPSFVRCMGPEDSPSVRQPIYKGSGNAPCLRTSAKHSRCPILPDATLTLTNCAPVGNRDSGVFDSTKALVTRFLSISSPDRDWEPMVFNYCFPQAPMNGMHLPFGPSRAFGRCWLGRWAQLTRSISHPSAVSHYPRSPMAKT